MHMSTLFAAWYSPENWPYIALAIFGLGFVIFVHELGHFLVAKACGVKCEKFYVGFDVPIKLGWGKFGIQLPASIWKRKWGETEYGIGMIPLGGYVKMLGQDDNPGRQAEMARMAKQAAAEKKQQAPGSEVASAAEAVSAGAEAKQEGAENFVYDPRSYMAKPVWKRMLIISAGVAMNILFAFIFAMIAFGMGVSYTRCDVAYVLPDSPCWNANFRPGYRFVEINGVKNPRFKDLRQEVILAAKGGVPATVEFRDADGNVKQQKIVLKPKLDPESGRKIAMIGMSPMPLLKLEEGNVARNGWAASKAKGFLANDTIVAVGGKPVSDYVEFSKVLAQNADQPLDITVERNKPVSDSEMPGSAGTERVTIKVAPMRLRRLGCVMTMGPVLAVQADSPAAIAGIKPGDEIVTINGEPVGDPIDLPEKLRRHAGETIRVVVRRIVDKASAELEFNVPSRQVGWYARLIEVMELPTLGIAYTVTPTVQSIDPDSAAVGKDIKPGDKVVEVQLMPADDKRDEELETFGALKPIPVGGAEGISWPDLVFMMQSAQPDTAVNLTVERGAKTHTVEIVPQVSDDSFYADRGFQFVGETDIMRAHSIGEAMSLGLRETKYAMLAVYRFLHKLLSGGISPRLLGGPGTILAAAGMSAKLGFADFLIFLTLLSANLAVVNFLPIPVLDGGHMVFLILEGIFRRPVSEKVVIPLTYLGLFLILGLMVFVIGLDVNRFILQ